MPPIALPLTPDAASLSFDDGDTRIHRSIGSTGVRVLTQRVPAAQSVSASLWVPVGSRDEDPARAGSTHFLEHLLFKGTARRSALDIAVAFDSVGGESNAETGREHTAYWARVRDADLGTAIDVLVDMVTGSVLDPADFDTERGVILDELAMGDDNPVEVVHDAFQLAVHGDTPIGRPVGGTADAIRAVGRDDVWEHYQSNYGCPSLIVVASGNVDHDELVERVDGALAASQWSTAPRPPRPRRPTSAPEGAGSAGEGVVERRRDVGQAHVVLGCEGLRATDEETPVMHVLLSVLGGSMSSRLFQEIREKRGLAYTTYAFASPYSDTGSFGMYAGTSPGSVPEVEAIMRAQLEDLATQGPSDEEMARVRGQVRGGLVLGLEDNWSRMMRLGRSEIMGRYRVVEETLRDIESVDAQQVRSLASRLAARLRARAVVLPRQWEPATTHTH